MDTSKVRNDLEQLQISEDMSNFIQMFMTDETQRQLLMRIAKGPAEVLAMRLEGIDDEQIDTIIHGACLILGSLVLLGTSTAEVLLVERSRQQAENEIS